MNAIRYRSKTTRGFSLIELLVAMAISMTLMAALASIFTQSIKTRDQIDRDGQKVEAARYSLDSMAEDIRLAGYFGNYSPPNIGSSPADWKYVSPCSVTGGSPLPGWNATTSPVQVPFAIFGYEAHGTGTLPTTTLTDCLDNYKTGTDVLVVRRASTTSVTAGGTGYVANDAYLQVSSCPDGTVDTQPFHAKATATSTDFNLNVLNCSTDASVRKLITRIYYISNCNDCTNDLDSNAGTTGDGIPTLKVVEQAIKPTVSTTVLTVIGNLRTIAPGVDDMHIEYGIDTTCTPWVTGTAVVSGAVRYNGSYYYTAAAAGTTGATAPTHNSASSSDGAVTWAYTGAVASCPADGSIDAWVVSNNDPRQTGATGTAVTGMRLDASTENRWEDVMAVKLFLISRDHKTTNGHIDTKSFVAGTKTIAATGDAFRRRMMSSTVKLINMAGRREVP